MNATIYILLPVHNRISVTEKFVKALKNQSYTDYHLVLIDDGSTDNTAEMVESNIPSVTIIKGQGKWWWAGSLQQGHLWLKSQKVNKTDIVLIINDDTVFEPDFLEKAVGLLESRKHSLLLSYCYSQHDKKLIDTGVYINWKTFQHLPAETVGKTNCLSTRGLFVRTNDFLDIGGFYPTLLPHYASDYEFTIRAHRQGLTLWSDETLKLWCDETQSGFKGVINQSFFQTFFQMFSIRSALNPWYRSIYVLLSCPIQWQPINYFRVWKDVFVVLLKAAWRDARNILF